MKQLSVTTLAGLLVLSVMGLALGQSSTPAPGNQGDELRLRPDADQATNGDTTVIDDSTSSSTPANNFNNNNQNNNQNQNQVQPFQPQNNDGQEQERPNHRRRPRPFNPFSFLLTPGFGSDPFNSGPGDFSPFRQSPLMDLLGGGVFDFPSPGEFRAHMDEQIKDMESKPDVWSKEVRRYTVNGQQFEKITFTRKVESQQQQQPAQIDMEQNGEQENSSQQAGEQRQRMPLFRQPSFGRSLDRSLSNRI